MAINVAQAFVQVVPTTENFLPELKKELGASLEAEGEKHGGSFMRKFGKGAVALAGATGAAIGAATGLIIKKAFAEGGELEQNLGGTEAVFGAFAENIQSEAETAYKNMGLSASEYMATANKMGALFQGSGFSAVESLTLTQQAMQRAADVASVMGIDTSAAMDAIAGAAKGNFTMMDNLGVSMNATALAAYAAEKGMTDFNYSTATQLEKTELAMQMFLEKTQQYEGNFAREASETLSGSLGSMQAALKNVLGNLALGRDVTPSLINLSQTVSDFLNNNAIPAVLNIAQSIPDVLGVVIEQGAPVIAGAGVKLLTSLITNLPTIIGSIVKSVPEIIAAILSALKDSWPQIKQAGTDMFLGLASGIGDAIGAVVARAQEAAARVLSSVKSFFGIHSPSVVMERQVGLQLMAGEARGITDNSDLVTKAIRTASAEASETFDTELAYNAAINADGMRSDTGGDSATARSIAKMVKAVENLKIYLDSGELVGGTSGKMDDALGAVGALESRGLA